MIHGNRRALHVGPGWKECKEGGKIELLVVEDEVLIRMHLADHLRNAGYVVCEANHAGEAISILEANPGIRAIITDIEMPGSAMDGLALAAAIAERWPPCKLVIVSGRSYPADTFLPSGAKFFRKPYAPEQICETLHGWGIAA